MYIYDRQTNISYEDILMSFVLPHSLVGLENNNEYNVNTGTVSKATLELFHRQHWNGFNGSTGTVSKAILELSQRQY